MTADQSRPDYGIGEPVPFFIVWSAEGSSTPQHFSDPIAAEMAAEALARLNPGAEYFICQPLAAVKLPDVEIRRFKLGGHLISQEVKADRRSSNAEPTRP